MMAAEYQSYLLIALAVVCLVLTVGLIALANYAKRSKAKLMQSIGLIDDLYKLVKAQGDSLQELKKSQELAQSQQKKRVESALDESQHLLQVNEQRMEKLEAGLERLEEQDPMLKMYSKAAKLVEQGADTEDIIEASGLPRAEVEVLVSLKKRTK